MRLFLLVLLFVIRFKSFATHIVGGEITYKKLAGNNNDYEITLIVYRDCLNGQAAFDSPGKITIMDKDSNVYAVVDIFNFNTSTLPVSINNPCIFPPGNICYDVARYTTVQSLVPITGGYYLIYQRCCRNNTILNLNFPGTQGATFMEHIPGIETSAFNNASPRFASLPPTFICANSFFSYNHSASDTDGDSLVYEFCKAYKGLDRCCPLIRNPGTNAIPPNLAGCTQPQPAICPEAATPPINFALNQANYDSVDYQSGYGSKKPFGLNTNITINPNTGVISGTVSALGQYVVAVCAKEYRNGVLIGVHRREFQFNVTACQKTIVSSIITPTVLCKNGVVFNANTTYTGPNSVAYAWNFGDPNSGTNNIAFIANPTHVFTDTGLFTITLNTYDVVDPSCNDVITKTVRILRPVSASFSTISPICKKTSIPFNISNISNPNNFALTYNWNFSDPQSGINNVSTLMNPNHSFTDTGTYNVLLNINVPSNIGCGNMVVQTIKVTEFIKANFSFPTDICKNQPIALNNTTIKSNLVNPINYNWQFQNANITNSNLQNPNISINGDGLYNVSLLVSSNTINGCKDSIIKQIEIKKLVLIPNVPSNICNTLTIPFISNSNFTTPISLSWNFGDLQTSNDTSTQASTSYTYPSIGTYNYTLNAIANNNSFCKDSIAGQVKILDLIQADFTSNIPFCANLPVLFQSTSTHVGLGNLNYTWLISQNNLFGDTIAYLFPDSGFYTVSILASNALYANCVASKNKLIKINPRLIAGLKLDTLYCKSLNTIAENLSRGSNNPTYKWFYDKPFNNPFSNSKQPRLNINDTGLKSIYLIYSDVQHPECADTAAQTLRIAPAPSIKISAKNENCEGANARFSSEVINKTGRTNIVYWSFSDGERDSGFQIQHAFPANATYTVTASTTIPNLQNCTDTSEKISIKINGRGELFVPNAFSPNNDENNDVFKIEGPPYEEFLMLVYNRFGEKVFESKDQFIGWSGKIRDNDAEPGVFGYYIKIKCPDGSTQIKKGNVTLLR
jgi:gliding motility-associated-like protein